MKQYILMAISCFFVETYSTYHKVLLHKAELAYNCLSHDQLKAYAILKEIIAELHSLYKQNPSDKALSETLSTVEFYLGCAEEKLSHDKLVCVMHYDRALRYTKSLFPHAFARLTAMYLALYGPKSKAADIDQDLLIHYIMQCDRHLAKSLVLSHEVALIATLLKAHIMHLIAAQWSSLTATAENREYIQKGLDYLHKLALYLENNSSAFTILKFNEYKVSIGYYTIRAWFSLGSYYTEQALLSNKLTDYDKALDYCTLLIKAYTTIFQPYEALIQLYTMQKQHTAIAELYQQKANTQATIEKCAGLICDLLVQKALLLQTNGKKSQLKQAILLLEDALSTLAPYQAQYNQKHEHITYCLAETKLKHARCNLQGKNKAYTQHAADIEYALSHGTVSTQTNALLMKANHLLTRATVCADLDIIAEIIDQANKKTIEPLEALVCCMAQFHRKRADLLVQDAQVLTSTAMQAKLQESITFLRNSLDRATRHAGIYYSSMWLIKQQTSSTVCQALELLQELTLEQYNPKNCKQLLTQIHKLAHDWHIQGKHTDAQQVVEILWDNYQWAPSGELLVTILAQHKESIECARRLIKLIPQVLLCAGGQHKQQLETILDSCYYIQARYNSGSFDRTTLEQTLDYFQEKQLLTDPAAQRAYTALAQHAQTTEELFELIDRFKYVTPYIKDALVNNLSFLCTHTLTTPEQQYKKQILEKEACIKKYSLFLSAEDQTKLLCALYSTYMPLLVKQYATILKMPKRSKKQDIHCKTLLTYIQQLLVFLRNGDAQEQVVAFQEQLQKALKQKPKRTAHKKIHKQVKTNIKLATPECSDEQINDCLESLTLHDRLQDTLTIDKQQLEQLNQLNVQKKRAVQEYNKLTDYYFFQGVAAAHQELQQRQEQQIQLSDACAQFLYKQAHVYLAHNQEAVLAQGFVLLKDSAALGNFAAAYELAHLYRRTHTVWPSLQAIFVDPISYGLPDYKYLTRFTHEPLVHSSMYKTWRSDFCKRAYSVSHALNRALIWSAYTSALDQEEYTSIIQDKHRGDAYLSGVAYAYFEKCQQICLGSDEQYLRDYVPAIQHLLEETIMCPEITTHTLPSCKKLKKEYQDDYVAQEIATWFERTQ